MYIAYYESVILEQQLNYFILENKYYNQKTVIEESDTKKETPWKKIKEFLIDKLKKVIKIFTSIKEVMKTLVHTVIPATVKHISMNIEDKLKNKNKTYKTIDIRGVIENIYCLANVVDFGFKDEGIDDIISISNLARLEKYTFELTIKYKLGYNKEWDRGCEETISTIQKSCNNVIAMSVEDLIKYGSWEYTSLYKIKDQNDFKYSYKEILELYWGKPWIQIETVDKRCNKYIEFLNRLIKDIDKNKDSINTDTRRMSDDDDKSEEYIDKYRNSIIEIKKRYNRLFANYTVALTHYASLCSRVNREYAANIKIMCDYFNKYLTTIDQNDDPYETDYDSDEEWEDELNDGE